jgi:hypothetical protein
MGEPFMSCDIKELDNPWDRGRSLGTILKTVVDRQICMGGRCIRNSRNVLGAVVICWYRIVVLFSIHVSVLSSLELLC